MSKKQQFSFEDFGKVPPHDAAMEEQILGAMLNNMQADLIGSWIEGKEGFFYVEQNAILYRVIAEARKATGSVDLMLVAHQAKKVGKLDEVGGFPGIAQISAHLPGKIEEKLMILTEHWMRRQLIIKGHETVAASYDPSTDIFDEVGNFNSKMVYAMNHLAPTRPTSAKDTIAQVVLDSVAAAEGRKTIIDLLPTGFRAFDRIFGGWAKTNFVVVAGRPGMGKTAFVLSVARRKRLMKKMVGIISLEMSKKELVQRLISAEAQVENSLISKHPDRLQSHEIKQIDAAASRLSDIGLLINDDPTMGIQQVCATIKQMADAGCEEVYVDYIQLIRQPMDSKQNRADFVAMCSRELKTAAKVNNVAVIGLAQLSRAVETRGGEKKPMLSDLRESGGIEQDADMVLFLYRPEYYGAIDGDYPPGAAEVIVAKHRNGGVGECILKFVNRYAEYTDMSDDAPPAFESKSIPFGGYRDPTEPMRNSSQDDAPF